MAGKGGAQKPDGKPRPPAGPGKLANRQDMSQPKGTPPVNAPGSTLQYGDGKRLDAAQDIAPIAAAPRPGRGAPAGAAPLGAEAAPPTMAEALNRLTGRPTEPITAGLPIGAGPGPEALYEETALDNGVARAMILAANRPDMPPEIRALGFLYDLAQKVRAARSATSSVPASDELDMEEFEGDDSASFVPPFVEDSMAEEPVEAEPLGPDIADEEIDGFAGA